MSKIIDELQTLAAMIGAAAQLAKRYGHKDLIAEVLRPAEERMREFIVVATGIEKNRDEIIAEAMQEADSILGKARTEAREITDQVRVASRREVVGEETFPDSYAVQTDPTDTLVVYCSSHKFREATDKFLKTIVPSGNFDLIAFPGATQMLAFGESLPKFASSLLRPIEFLVKGHNIKRVIVIMHEDCDWYKSFVPTFLSVGNAKIRQVGDMVHTRGVLTKLFPGVEVGLYYAEKVDHSGVKFVKV